MESIINCETRLVLSFFLPPYHKGVINQFLQPQHTWLATQPALEYFLSDTVERVLAISNLMKIIVVGRVKYDQFYKS